jgi:YidC/Oxa1 family membrane protein insertase
VIQIFNNIADGMGAVLAFLYGVVPNYGLAIIGLTILVRLVLFPMTAKQARSMQKMQQIQPEIKKLQAKYKDNRQQLNEEIMKFYKENKVNPMAGCLPLVLQMPVFFALFRVLREPLKHIPHDSKLFHAFCHNLDSTACGKTAGFPKGLSFLGLDLSKSAADLTGGFTKALPYFLLIALVVVTGYLQFKQTQSRQTSAQANPQAAMMGKIFPALFAFISYRLPSGVVLYFLVSNGWQIGQQALIFRTMPDPVVGGASGGAVTASGSAPRPTGKGGDGKPKAETETPEPPPEGRFKRALGQAREAGKGGGRGESGGNGDAPPAKPAPKRPPSAGGARPPGDGGMGRAQPSGSQPRPKKRRR